MLALVDGRRTPASPGGAGTCGDCGGNVDAKCGRVIMWHWAHAARDCDPWAEPDTRWHQTWQARVPADRREITIGNHRADIIAGDGTVVELQHSYLPPDQIAKREDFYDRMVWVFDATESYREERLDVRVRPGDTYATFRWKHPRKSIAICSRPVLLDLGDGRLFRPRRMYPDAPCGGWGQLLDASQFVAWLNSGPAQRLSA